MCKNGLLKPYMCGLHSAEMTLKFHSYCCVNAKYHLKNALKNNKKSAAIWPQLWLLRHFLHQSDSDNWERLPLAIAVIKAVEEMSTFLLQEKVFILFPSMEEELYLLKSIQCQNFGGCIQNFTNFPLFQGLTKPKPSGKQLFMEWRSSLVEEPL